MSRLPSSFDNAEPSDRDLPFIDRVYKHCREQPLVPIGALLTTGAVILAAKSLRAGHRKDAQKWFRYRVGFQGATIVALVVGGYYYGTVDPATKKSKEDVLREKAKMREKLWIEELERRDAEAKLRKKRAELAKAKMLELEKNKIENSVSVSDEVNTKISQDKPFEKK